eukprot:gnl/MRDRNA2_/MRDRNA2_81305_c0_seq1.p2 gnl/MRDRNA2_/MRDRNA2_81305_c0~~gnl/MRDRNA2_/MRDRNA2_81305_c0_seq1.p2  ORF type:complete len:101 (+),score=10.81 gnl/MRDRNA2_/MRDRNA2_81305_c0_seq1:422-724(+)
MEEPLNWGHSASARRESTSDMTPLVLHYAGIAIDNISLRQHCDLTTPSFTSEMLRKLRRSISMNKDVSKSQGEMVLKPPIKSVRTTRNHSNRSRTSVTAF